MNNTFKIVLFAVVFMMSFRSYGIEVYSNLVGEVGVPNDFFWPPEARLNIHVRGSSLEFARNDETDFISFSFSEQTREAIIDLNNHSISIEVAPGTNVTSLVSTFSLSTGGSAKVGSMTQVSGSTPNDFTNSVIYSVSSENGESTQDWVVSIFIRTEGLIAYYPFDGNANDQSTNALHGTVEGGATLTSDRFGKENSAYYFDGSGYINCGTSTVFDLGKYSEYTISAWIKPNKSISNNGISILSRYLSSQDNRYYNFFLNKESKEIGFIIYENGLGNPRNDPSFGYNDSWQHVVVTKENDILKLYLNLHLVSEVPVTVTMKENNTDTHFIIGARHGSSTLWDDKFEGMLDDIVLYEKALSENEMSFLYGAENQATDITSFGFSEQTIEESIDESMHTIDLAVAKGTDVSTLNANFTLSFGASAKVGSVTQVSGATLNDFTNPVTYTVTAEDGESTQDWVVRVERESLSRETDMISYSLPTQISATILDPTNHTIDVEVPFETELRALVPSFTLSSGASATVEFVNQVSGTTPNDFSQAVVYKLTAENGETSQDWTVTVRVDEAPAFSNFNYNQTYTIGNGGLNVSAIINSEKALSSVIMYHKELTVSAYRQIEISGVDGKYIYFFSDNDFDKLGLTFYLSAEDINGNLVLSDNQIISTIAQDDVEFIPALISSTDPLDYAIISIPYRTSAVTDVFSVLGSNEDGSWKLSHHDGSEQYQYFPDDFSQFEPGKGYWFLSLKPTDFLLKGGTAVSVSDDDPFTIQLRANDWNMIGNPFPYTIDWQVVIDHNADSGVTIESLVTFKEGGYKTGQLTLNKYDGAFLFSPSNVALEIPLSAISSTSGRVATTSNRNNTDGFDTGDWEIGLNLSSDALAYNVSGIGMKSDASNERDQYDWPMLLRLGSYLDLSFESGITKSVVTSADSYAWDFTVNSSKKGKSIQLSWESLDVNNYDHSLSLLDIENQIIIDMGERSSFEFNQNSESKAFKILYAPKGVQEYVDFGYSFVGEPYPNPFNKDLTVPVSTTASDAVVKVTIYNILGKEVYQLEESNVDEGYHNLLLKLSEESLISDHSGTYILNVFVQSRDEVSQVNKRIIFNQ